MYGLEKKSEHSNENNIFDVLFYTKHFGCAVVKSAAFASST